MEVLGGVAAAAGIIATITKMVKGLSDLQSKYSEAENSIRLLIRQLTAIKASLIQISDWTELQLAGSPREADLVEAFKISLEGCQEAMQSMADEVATLAQDALAGDRRTMRTRYIWNEESMKDHQGRLDSQVQALQLLLSAVQCRTASEQTALLREPRNRQIVQKISDDTSSLRSIRRLNARSNSFMSHGNETIGSTEFEMDNIIVNTDAYRRVMHGRARSADESSRRSQIEGSPASPSIEHDGPSSFESRLAGESESSNYLSPIDARVNGRWGRPRPYERSVVSDPAGIPRQRSKPSRPMTPLTSASEPFLRNLNLQIRPKVVSKKRSLLPSLFTGSSATLNALSPRDALRVSPNVRRGRRHSDTDIHQSINFSSIDGRTAPPLVQAAQSGSGTEIEELLDQGANVDSRHERTKRTALAVASHCGNDDVVAILLSHGANPRCEDATGMTPLHLAATRGHYRVVEYLLKEDVDIDALGPDRKTPLRLATDNGYIEVADLLLSHRAKVNSRDAQNLTALHSAAQIGDEEVVSLLLRYKADIEAKDGNFMAAIHHASERGRARVVEILLAKKADIEAQGKESMSPLASACASGSTDVVQLLLQRKASLRHKGDGDMSPLHWASYNGHSDIVDMLLERRTSLGKVPVDARTTDGRTPLHLAAMSDNFATAEVLLRRGASVEALCQNGLRPLHYAAMIAQSPDLVQLLLGHGASTEAESGDGKKPLHYATYLGNTAVLDLLLRRGAFIDARDGSGDRPLQIASAQGNLEAVNLLLERGAEMRSRYSKGPSHEDSPLCIAAKHGYLSIVEEFVRRGASVRQRDESNWQPLRYAAYYAHPEVCQFLLMNGASLSGLDNPGSFGFNLTASRIGFAPAAGIDEYRRQSVLMLLNDAEVREQEALNNASPPYQIVTGPQQDSPAEKADDGDEEETSNYTHYAATERQELPVLQRSPRQIPPPYQGHPSNGEPQGQAPQARATETSTSSASPESRAAGRSILDERLNSSPQWNTVISPPVSSLLPPRMRYDNSTSPLTVSPLPSQNYNPARAVLPLPSQHHYTTQFESHQSGTSTIPQSPNRPPPPPPVQSTHVPTSNTPQQYTPFSPPPTRVAPLPPDLIPVPSPEEAIVVCEACEALGRATTDLACPGCRRALNMYHSIMGSPTSADIPTQYPVYSAQPIVHELA